MFNLLHIDFFIEVTYYFINLLKSMTYRLESNNNYLFRAVVQCSASVMVQIHFYLLSLLCYKTIEQLINYYEQELCQNADFSLKLLNCSTCIRRKQLVFVSSYVFFNIDTKYSYNHNIFIDINCQCGKQYITIK